MRYIRNKLAERFKSSGLQDTLTEKIKRSISPVLWTLSILDKKSLKPYIMLISNIYEKSKSKPQVLNCTVHSLNFKYFLPNSWDFVTTIDSKWVHTQINKQNILIVSSFIDYYISTPITEPEIFGSQQTTRSFYSWLLPVLQVSVYISPLQKGLSRSPHQKPTTIWK